MASFEYGGLVEQTTIVTTAAGTTTLTNTSHQIQIFTGSAAQTIILPSATTMSTGQKFEIYNQSSSGLTLQFNGGSAFTDASGKNFSVINANTSLLVKLQTNGTSVGTWAAFPSNGGIGAPGPTIQKFTSGSGTYTTPTNVSFIRVRMVGGGGGGSGSGSGSGTAATDGGNTTFGTSLLVANGGVHGVFNANGGAGGTASLGSGPIGTALAGGTGSGYIFNNSSITDSGPPGASSPFGGAGTSTANNSPTAAITNTGSGGAGGWVGGSGVQTGSAGGAGGFVDAVITSPNATYSYAVGGAGSGGGAGSSGNIGGAGGSGYIEVTEYYFNGLGASAGNGGAYTPTVTTYTSGSGTFTTPVNASYLQIKMVGGGGGGGGSGSSTPVGGTSATATTFFNASAGAGAQSGSNGAAGAGGTSSLGSGAIGIALTGSMGVGGQYSGASTPQLDGGMGGNAPYFNGAGTTAITIGTGGTAVANSGSGGSGGCAGGSSNIYSGGGGGSGGFIEMIIVSPASTYTYTVGTGGTAGASGGAFAGGAGAAGLIEITTYYNNGAVGTATSITGSVNSSQVLGTTAGGNAPTGYVGEFISANPGSGVAVGSSGSFVTITSISLTAGDWDVEGTISLVTGSTTAGTVSSGGISLNPTSEDSQTNGGVYDAFATFVANSTYLNPTGKRRINVSTTTTVYLVGAATYSVAGGATWGTNSFIGARRVR